MDNGPGSRRTWPSGAHDPSAVAARGKKARYYASRCTESLRKGRFSAARGKSTDEFAFRCKKGSAETLLSLTCRITRNATPGGRGLFVTHRPDGTANITGPGALADRGPQEQAHQALVRTRHELACPETAGLVLVGVAAP